MFFTDHLDLLGKRVVDRVTGFRGVVTCISYDLYGCIQAIVKPLVGKDNTLQEVQWFDVSWLEELNSTPVMPMPDFNRSYIAQGNKGPAEKPCGD